MKPPFGVIRRLYTPEHGTEITSVADIKDGGDYVAAGVERFKPLHYRAIVSARTKSIANKGMVGVPGLVCPTSVSLSRPAPRP